MNNRNIMSSCVKYFSVVICLFVIILVLATRTEAIPSHWNGNSYELVLATDISWDDANAAANARGGHLATITSAEENAFVVSLAPYSTILEGAWLGGRSPEGWLVGPEAGNDFLYNNFQPEENPGYAWMFFASLSMYPRGGWGDDVDGISDSGNPIRGYFIEYEKGLPVPEPSTILLLILGVIGLVGYRR
jgi:hypothetical protein